MLRDFLLNHVNNTLLKYNSREQEIKVENLITKNREDIKLRIKFLEEVIGNNKDYKETSYYWFIGDKQRWAHRNPKKACTKFEQLFRSLDRIGLEKPIAVCRPKSSFTVRDKSHDKDREMNTRFQLEDGAHRLAIFSYLGQEKIPCRLYTPMGRVFPDYTTYIKNRSEYYNRKKNGTYS